MLSKESLLKEFSKDWKKHYSVALFGEKGFVRKKCAGCGKSFWAMDADRELCADSPCQKYEFINHTVTKGKWDYTEMWRLFEKFFVKKGHASIPRYPVVDRWRPDLFFTIASIQDFQRIDNGNMNFVYPANPLIVPQVSLRFPDIQNVGVTGRHLTSFVMSGQHSFNYPNEEGSYFKDRCLELNFEFLTGEMGIPEQELVYVEDLWSMPDFSAFGPNMETFALGLELVNSVFMQFQKMGAGYSELDMKVIDVGWGHERLVWFSNGTPASYDSLFGPLTTWMKKESGIRVDKAMFEKYCAVAGGLDMNEAKNIGEARKRVADAVGLSVDEMKREIEPLQALYAVADHTRTLLFAVTDGGIPSNVGGGYNLRVVLRRALSFIDEFGFPFDMMDIAEMHAKYLKPMFPELSTELGTMSEIIDIERRKFKNTAEKSGRIIKSLIEKNYKFDEGLLVRLYESHGITPEEIEKHKKDLEIPQSFYNRITEKHSIAKSVVEKAVSVSNIPPTEALFYEPIKEFGARVLKIMGDSVVLDKTAFFAMSGGQIHDTGSIEGRKVLDVVKTGAVVIHKLDSAKGLKEGQEVKCALDWDRRLQIGRNHTAVHIINGAARKVLGNHVWQAGSEVREEKARLDITHFDLLNEKQLRAIEDEANGIVRKGVKVEKQVLDRKDAEQCYGFRVYQGGAIPEKRLRILKIGDFDIEACGGTHVDNTSELGVIKILRTTKVQDGVIRLEFVASRMAEEIAGEDAEIFKEVVGLLPEGMRVISKDDASGQLQEAVKVLSVSEKGQVAKTLRRFLGEIEQNEKSLAALRKLVGVHERCAGRAVKAKRLPDAAQQIFDSWKVGKKELSKFSDDFKAMLTKALTEEKWKTDLNNTQVGKVTVDLYAERGGESIAVWVAPVADRGTVMRLKSVAAAGRLPKEAGVLIVVPSADKEILDFARGQGVELVDYGEFLKVIKNR